MISKNVRKNRNTPQHTQSLDRWGRGEPRPAGSLSFRYRPRNEVKAIGSRGGRKNIRETKHGKLSKDIRDSPSVPIAARS